LEPSDTGQIDVNSLDYDYEVAYSLYDDLIYDGNMDLVKGVINHFKEKLNGGKITYWCDAPPGSGLGSSSTIVAALVGVFVAQNGESLDPYEVAELTIDIERNKIGIVGGRQDQYSAVFGGVNLMEFKLDRTIVNPLRLPQSVVNELEYSMLVGYTGRSRHSGKIIEFQQEKVKKNDSVALEAMHRQKEHAVDMKEALLLGDIPAFGMRLREAWEDKKKFSNRISTSFIDKIMESALNAGAWGGKISGAGGGGFAFFLAPIEKRRDVAAALRRNDVQLVDIQIEMLGLQTWRVSNK
jgi:D-glycero-alpha-D-manno-heptose-7-phosphate kinase